ncbi:hypothetical protein FRC03_007640, partial [Tulasnella sp. 419]
HFPVKPQCIAVKTKPGTHIWILRTLLTFWTRPDNSVAELALELRTYKRGHVSRHIGSLSSVVK